MNQVFKALSDPSRREILRLSERTAASLLGRELLPTRSTKPDSERYLGLLFLR